MTLAAGDRWSGAVSSALSGTVGDGPVRAALLLTDLVDSASLTQQLGDQAAAALWAAHDRLARDLLRTWRGREIDKSDGFLLLFEQPADALGYALAYHRALAGLPSPVRARAGLHVGHVTVRENPAEDVTLGAKPVEVDGMVKPVAARVMSVALGGQTLVTSAALAALGPVPQRIASHGFWRIKGLPEPLELHEVGDDTAPFTPPPDGDKVYRVVREGDGWVPARDLRNTLPAERDSFVGRRATLLDIARRFEEGARLVSVLGIGGAGKTRVAARYGRTWLGDHPGGVWFCDLAVARTLDGLLSAVAVGLEVPLADGDPVQQLGDVIAGRGTCLVILDNFEQVARHAEATVGRWLERAPQARFLVTSREVLGIGGEQVIALASMRPADAETLFMVRAAAARRDFRPSADERAAIGTLVQLLDGLPLAIELAAARVRTLLPRALLGRMSERFRLLAASSGRMDRQATLRATFDWSWDLLAPVDRRALAQAAVFQGGFTVEAAEAVLDLADVGEGAGGAAPWMVDVVQSLVDKSFVRALPDERFDLLGSVQAYALEHLSSEGRYPGSGPGALRQAQQRHAAYYAGLGPRRALDHACADLDNLVIACRFAAAAGTPEVAARALEGAWEALWLRGPFQAGLVLAEAVCALPDLPASAAARAHGVRGNALRALGRRADASLAFERALQHALAHGADGARAEAAARLELGVTRRLQGEAQAAREETLRARTLAEACGDPGLLARAAIELGALALSAGDLAATQAEWEHGLALARAHGERRVATALSANLGALMASLGRLDDARRWLEESLALARALGDRQREGNNLCNLSVIELLQDRYDAAVAQGEAALPVARDLGHADLEMIVSCNLGLAHDRAGRLPQARACLEAALALARRLQDRRGEGQALGYLALVQARQGEHAAARAGFDAGQALLAGLDDAFSLTSLVAARAEAEWLAGDAAAARASRDEARALLVRSGAGSDSEPGSGVRRLARVFGEDAGGSAPADSVPPAGATG